MSNDYASAWDALSATIGAAEGRSTGSIDQLEHLTIDQRLQVVQISALLSIAQEISAFNPSNETHYGEDGIKRNAWGVPLPK